MVIVPKSYVKIFAILSSYHQKKQSVNTSKDQYIDLKDLPQDVHNFFNYKFMYTSVYRSILLNSIRTSFKSIYNLF